MSEEEHVDWLETQLETIRQVGIENYLAQQMHWEVRSVFVAGPWPACSGGDEDAGAGEAADADVVAVDLDRDGAVGRGDRDRAAGQAGWRCSRNSSRPGVNSSSSGMRRP